MGGTTGWSPRLPSSNADRISADYCPPIVGAIILRRPEEPIPGDKQQVQESWHLELHVGRAAGLLIGSLNPPQIDHLRRRPGQRVERVCKRCPACAIFFFFLRTEWMCFARKRDLTVNESDNMDLQQEADGLRQS